MSHTGPHSIIEYGVSGIFQRKMNYAVTIAISIVLSAGKCVQQELFFLLDVIEQASKVQIGKAHFVQR